MKVHELLDLLMYVDRDLNVMIEGCDCDGEADDVVVRNGEVLICRPPLSAPPSLAWSD